MFKYAPKGLPAKNALQRKKTMDALKQSIPWFPRTWRSDRLNLFQINTKHAAPKASQDKFPVNAKKHDLTVMLIVSW